MRLASWNINGIRAVHKKGQLVPFFKKFNPDVVGFQETKAEQHQSEVDLPEYEEYWNSAEKKGYSGTAIFTKHTPLSVRLGIPEKIAKKHGLVPDAYGDTLTEGRVIAAEFPALWFVTVYTPNAKDGLERLDLRAKQWDPAFLDYMRQLEKDKPVVFCGDLNVAHGPDDLTHPKQNEGGHGYTNEERAGIDRMVDAGFVDTFRMFTQGNGHYTWWSNWSNARARNVGWRIDYFFVSQSLAKKVRASTIHAEIMGSDHCPVILDLDV
jgi:exodeoxyribonuclease-3